jgi:hypothetical protein
MKKERWNKIITLKKTKNPNVLKGVLSIPDLKLEMDVIGLIKNQDSLEIFYLTPIIEEEKF